MASMSEQPCDDCCQPIASTEAEYPVTVLDPLTFRLAYRGVMRFDSCRGLYVASMEPVKDVADEPAIVGG